MFTSSLFTEACLRDASSLAGRMVEAQTVAALRFASCSILASNNPVPAGVLVFLHWKVLVLSFVSEHQISSEADQREASPSRFSWIMAPPPAWTEVLFLGSFLTLALGFIENWVGLPGVPYRLARPGRNARAVARLRLSVHALLLCWKLSKRACLAFCISSAAAVSVLLLAWRSRS